MEGPPHRSEPVTSPIRPAWIPERLYPFRSRYLSIDGCRLHYIDEGEGPPLLLLHGNPTWSFVYREIVLALRDRFRCIAPDYPGFGLSVAHAGYGFTPAEHTHVVEQLVQHLDLEGGALMGQEWGGPIGLAIAARHPDRFRALVLGNSWAWPVNRSPRFAAFSRLVGGSGGSWLIEHLDAFVELGLRLGATRKLPREVMDAYRGPFPTPTARLPTAVFPREILGSRHFLLEVEHGLRALAEKPTLLVWGDRDLAFRGPERRRFERTFPLHETVILRGAGHYIQEDDPRGIARAIRRFWDDRFTH
ncbi:alpha/beta fold hydrolase [Vulgatibacter sp.]|uniref:alpha/beta fold hydrolase n=1 Tax=Vulgatibacter sp. TaxID=1971226 RepID=UPI003561DA69